MANSNKAGRAPETWGQWSFAQEVRLNLCDPDRDVDGYRFTCASKADGVTTWQCTGSEHRDLGEVICSCECHHAYAEKEPGCVFCGAPGLRCCSTHKATVCQRCYDVVTEHFLVPTPAQCRALLWRRRHD